MPPVYPRHATTVSLLNRKLLRQFDGQAEIRIQQPVTLSSVESEPEPDFLLARGDVLTYAERHPIPEKILLIGEVSDNTMTYDRTTKVSLYALASIKEYWIANVQDNQLEIHRDPEVSSDGTSGSYRTKLTFDPEDSVAPLAFPDQAISLEDLFPFDVEED